MHETDSKLIGHVEEFVFGRKRTKISDTVAQRLEDAMFDYQCACRLVRGPDASRSAYWSEEAEVRSWTLQRRLDIAAANSNR